MPRRRPRTQLVRTGLEVAWVHRCALYRARDTGVGLIQIKPAAAASPNNGRSLARAKRCRTTRRMIMRSSSSLRTAILVATTALLSAGAQAGPMPTNVAAIKSMVDQSTTEVRWGGGFRGGGLGYRGGGFRGGGFGYRGVGFRGGGLGYRGVGFRGGGWGYRGGLGYRGWGRGIGYGLGAGAIAGGAIASSAYYGGYGGYYGGYPYDSYAADVDYGYGGGYGGGCGCPSYGGYAASRYYGW
jgi:hypothetical protein